MINPESKSFDADYADDEGDLKVFDIAFHNVRLPAANVTRLWRRINQDLEVSSHQHENFMQAQLFMQP